MKIEKIILDKLSDTLAGIFLDIIIETSKIWRFYFDENEQQKIKNGLKKFISGVIKNAKMQ